MDNPALPRIDLLIRYFYFFADFENSNVFIELTQTQIYKIHSKFTYKLIQITNLIEVQTIRFAISKGKDMANRKNSLLLIFHISAF